MTGWLSKSPVRRYGWAVAVLAVLLGARLALEPWLQGRLPLVTVLVAVSVCAWTVGAGPAVLAALLGFGAVASGRLLPLPLPWFAGSFTWAAVGFALAAAVLVAFGATVQRHRKALETHLAQRQARTVDDAVRARRAALADARFAAVVRHSSEAVMTASLDGRIDTWNPAAEQLFGWSADEIIGRPIDLLCPPDRFDEHHDWWSALLRGETRKLETRRRAKSGEDIDVLLSAAPLRDEAGHLVGVSSLALDIRERLAAERALQRSESLLRSLYQNTRLCMGVVELTDDRDILHLEDNLGTCRVFGVPEGATANRRASALGAAPEVIEVWLSRYQESLAQQRPVSFEYALQHPNGRRWFDATVAPLQGPPGERPRFSYTFEETTDRHYAQLRVRQSAAHARLALDVAEIGTWSWDPATDLLRVDTRGRSLCDLPARSQLHWQDLIERVHPDDRETFQQAVHEARLPRGPGTYSCELRFVHRDGTVRWVVSRGQMLASHPGVDPDAGPIVINTVLDVTARKEAEQLMAESDRRKNEFIATLAHELRNPLAPLRTGVEVLRRGDDDPALRRRVLATMERQLAQMVRMIDDLLDVSRITRDQLELRRRPLKLAQVIEAAVETSQPLITAQSHTLDLRVPDEPVVVMGDQARLTQVLSNLLNNAAKYTPDGGHIVVTLSGDEHEGRISVCDDGIGIAPALLPRVFDMFTQIDRDALSSQGGLGIGLAISRRLVALHGGELIATSDGLGCGSCFTIVLPRMAQAAVAEHDSRPCNVTTSRRILVVDDNVDAAQSMCELLTLYGHDARPAHDGPSALALAAQWLPEVALLDIGMPGMDGYEVARRLADQTRPHVPLLLAVTGWGQQSDRRRSAEAGFDDHLVKPVEPMALLRLIDSLPASAATTTPSS